MVMEAFHLDGAIGPIFCLAWSPPPETPPRFGVLCIPPFAEENNKSRRMIAQQARALARLGGMTLLVDMTGTGDSVSDFRDATWEHWRRDLDVAWSWLTARVQNPLWIWGIRLGGLLAAQQEHFGAINPEGLL